MIAERNPSGEWSDPKSPIRVLLIAPSTALIGGQSIQAARLLEGFRREEGVELHHLAPEARLPGILRRVRGIRFLRTAVNIPLYIRELLRRIPCCDIVHAFSAHHTSFLLVPAPATLIARFFRKGFILHYHSGFAEEHLRLWGKTAIPLMRLAGAIVVPSGFLVGVFGRFGLGAFAIHNLVDTERFVFRPRDPLQPRFLANRALEPSYNVGCLLRAFGLIQGRHPEATLTLAGDGPERRRLEDLSATLGLRNVRFLGMVPAEEMPELYDDAHIYLNSPNADNMPNAVIEAFASGTAVVSTNAGGIPYIVEDGSTGMLVDCNDHIAMAEKAAHLLKDPELTGRITAAAHRECRKYQWSAVRGHWLGLYRRLMAAPAPKRAGRTA